MGINERKQREKEQLKTLIVDAATSIYVEHGIEKTSIRAIADKIEYSPATIYLYVKNKDELLYLIMERAFTTFFQYLSSTLSIEDPMERVKQLGWKYLEFVMTHPGYYNLMFVETSPMQAIEDKNWTHGAQSHQVLMQTVEQCIEQGHFKGHEKNSLSMIIWSFIHGLATLNMKKRLDMYENQEKEDLIKDTLNAFNKMMDKI